MVTGTPSGEKKKKNYFVCFWCSVMLAGVFCGGFVLSVVAGELCGGRRSCNGHRKKKKKKRMPA
jgi:hypothetical protein